MGHVFEDQAGFMCNIRLHTEISYLPTYLDLDLPALLPRNLYFVICVNDFLLLTTIHITIHSTTQEEQQKQQLYLLHLGAPGR